MIDVEKSQPAVGYIYVDEDRERIHIENRFLIDPSNSFEEIKQNLKDENAEISEKEPIGKCDGVFSLIGYEAYYKFLLRDGNVEIHTKQEDLTHLGWVKFEN